MNCYENGCKGQHLNPMEPFKGDGIYEIYLANKFKYTVTTFPPYFVIYKFNSEFLYSPGGTTVSTSQA